MTPPRTILLIDDHPLFREGLRSILSKDDRFLVAAEAGTRAEGIEAAQRLKPDFALVDISLPDGSGLRLVRELIRIHPDIRCIVLSVHTRSELVAEALRAGAAGYVTKGSSPGVLFRALEAAEEDRPFLDNQIFNRLRDDSFELPDRTVAGLTKREAEIMVLVADGLTSRQIAGHLFISPKTVENHRAKIMNKLGLNNLAELVKCATRLGLIDSDEPEPDGRPKRRPR